MFVASWMLNVSFLEMCFLNADMQVTVHIDSTLLS